MSLCESLIATNYYTVVSHKLYFISNMSIAPRLLVFKLFSITYQYHKHQDLVVKLQLSFCDADNVERYFSFTAPMFYGRVINPRGRLVSVYALCQGQHLCGDGGVLQDISTGWTVWPFCSSGFCCLQDDFCHHLAAMFFFLFLFYLMMSWFIVQLISGTVSFSLQRQSACQFGQRGQSAQVSSVPAITASTSELHQLTCTASSCDLISKLYVFSSSLCCSAVLLSRWSGCGWRNTAPTSRTRLSTRPWGCCAPTYVIDSASDVCFRLLRLCSRDSRNKVVACTI